jgi:choline transport protein
LLTWTQLQAPGASSAKAFTEFLNVGGWSWPSLSVLSGQVTSAFTCLGYDAIVHLAEEVEDAATVVPKSMIRGYLLNAPMLFLVVIANGYNTASVELTSPLIQNYPFVWPMYNATAKSTGATIAFLVVITVLLAMTSVTVVAAISRLTLAFSRDHGLPSCMRGRPTAFRSPVNAVLLSTGFVAVLSLIRLFSPLPPRNIQALATAALMCTYIICLGCSIYKRLTEKTIPQSPFSLGRYGLSINCIGMAYACWALFWSCWPYQPKVTVRNFNWGPITLIGLMLVAVGYFISNKRKYKGPVTRVQSWMHDW